jgi:hypothetical protein
MKRNVRFASAVGDYFFCCDTLVSFEALGAKH